MSKWRSKALDLFPHLRAEIQSADSAGHLWIELISRLKCHYIGERWDTPADPSEFVRATCLYAIWCTRSESPTTQESAWIEFYEYLPGFALQCADSTCKRIVRDLVANIGITEIEKMGVSLEPSNLERFLGEARRADNDRRRRSRKR